MKCRCCVYTKHSIRKASWIFILIFGIIIRVFCPMAVLHCKCRNQGCSSAEGRSSTANSGTKAAVLSGMNRCGSFPLLSTPLPLASEQTLKDPRGTNVVVWGVDLVNWALRTSYRNSRQGLNISSIRVFDQIRDPETPITLCPQYWYNVVYIIVCTCSKLFGRGIIFSAQET